MVSDAATGEAIHTLTTTGRPEPATRTGSVDVVGSVLWSEDGDRLVYSIGARVAVWRLGVESPELLASFSLPGQGNRADGLELSPNGRLASLRELPDRIHVWDASSGNKKLTWENDNRQVQWHTWLPDSQRIVLRDVDGLAVLTVSDLSIRRLPRRYSRGYRDLAASGNLIASATGGVVQLLDADLRQKLLILPELDSSRQALFITPRGQFEITPGAGLPRVVVLEDGKQRLITVREFTDQYGWSNARDSVAAWNR